MDKIEAMLTKLPHFYAKEETSQIYNLLKAFADEMEIVVSQYIERADNAIGIMTTDARDLDWRWGRMMGFDRHDGEADEAYRMRLVNMINALRGGTAPAVQYAVALILGFADNTDEMDRKIHVIDSWKAENVPPEFVAFGNFVVVVKLDAEDFDLHYYDGADADIDEIVKVVKAAGTNCLVLIGNTTYEELEEYHHHQLGLLAYGDIRAGLSDRTLPHVPVEGFYDSNAREIRDVDGVRFYEGTDKPERYTEAFDKYGAKLFDADGVGIIFSQIIEKVFTGLRDRYGAELHDLDGIGLYPAEEDV